MASCTMLPQPERQSLRPVPHLQGRRVELELQLARQRVKCQQSVCGAHISFHFSPGFPGEFCFFSWPLHPPSILPISSIGRDKAIYFLSSIECVSQRIMRRTRRVSSLRIAVRTNGNFSSRDM